MRDLCEYKEVPKLNIEEFQSIFSLHKKGQGRDFTSFRLFSC